MTQQPSFLVEPYLSLFRVDTSTGNLSNTDGVNRSPVEYLQEGKVGSYFLFFFFCFRLLRFFFLDSLFCFFVRLFLTVGSFFFSAFFFFTDHDFFSNALSARGRELE